MATGIQEARQQLEALGYTVLYVKWNVGQTCGLAVSYGGSYITRIATTGFVVDEAEFRVIIAYRPRSLADTYEVTPEPGALFPSNSIKQDGRRYLHRVCPTCRLDFYASRRNTVHCGPKCHAEYSQARAYVKPGCKA